MKYHPFDLVLALRRRFNIFTPNSEKAVSAAAALDLAILYGAMNASQILSQVPADMDGYIDGKFKTIRGEK